MLNPIRLSFMSANNLYVIKHTIGLVCLILVYLYPPTAAGNTCTASNYSARYSGDPIPFGSSRTGETLGKIYVSFNYSCLFTDAHTIKLFGTWGQKSHISGNKFKSNITGIQLETPYPIGTSGPHNNSILFGTFHSDTTGSVSGIIFYVKKVGNVATSNDASVFLGTSHSDHKLQFDFFRPFGSHGEARQNSLGFVEVPYYRPTCEVDVADQNKTVTLPRVNSSGFGAIGSVLGSTPFSIKLTNCAAGATASMAMVDSTASGNVSDILTLSRTSTAAGVGLQILNNGNPVTLGIDNKWHVAGSAGGTSSSYTIPFFVRYVKTENSITPGIVNAVSQVTFSYW